MAVVVHMRETRLGAGIAALRCFRVPLHRQFIVLFYTKPGIVHFSEIGLRIHIAAFRGFRKPGHRELVVFLDALTEVVHTPEIILRRSIAAFRCRHEPTRRSAVILLDALSLIVHGSDVILRRCISLFGQWRQYFHGGFILASVERIHPIDKLLGAGNAWHAQQRHESEQADEFAYGSRVFPIHFLCLPTDDIFFAVSGGPRRQSGNNAFTDLRWFRGWRRWVLFRNTALPAIQAEPQLLRPAAIWEPICSASVSVAPAGPAAAGGAHRSVATPPGTPPSSPPARPRRRAGTSAISGTSPPPSAAARRESGRS